MAEHLRILHNARLYDISKPEPSNRAQWRDIRRVGPLWRPCRALLIGPTSPKSILVYTVRTLTISSDLVAEWLTRLLLYMTGHSNEAEGSSFDSGSGQYPISVILYQILTFLQCRRSNGCTLCKYIDVPQPHYTILPLSIRSTSSDILVQASSIHQTWWRNG